MGRAPDSPGIHHSEGTIFLPLFASLLIPLMAIYMNKVEDGEFHIDAFELCNIVIGGLFAVIAMSFAVNSAYPMLGDADNTVTRLFGWNLVLGAALTNHHPVPVQSCPARLWQIRPGTTLPLRRLGRPLLVLATAIALLLVAMA